MSQSTAGAQLADGLLHEQFRSAMRLHAAGVCIISIGTGDQVNGMAATAVTSFCMAPASMLVCVNRTASMAGDLVPGVVFGITLLGRQHEEVAAAFSRKPMGLPRFSYGDWRLEADSPPWLADAPANLACQIEHTFEFGTHRAVVGLVRAVHLGPPGASLVYRDGSYQ